MSVPANDAHLVQLVRGALGQAERFSAQRINVSSCGFVVTLHGVVPDSEARSGIENATRKVPGVREVINKLRVSEASDTIVFPQTGFRVSNSTEYPKVRE